MPRLTHFDRWLSAFEEMSLADQAGALIQVNGIHRRAVRRAEKTLPAETQMALTGARNDHEPEEEAE